MHDQGEPYGWDAMPPATAGSMTLWCTVTEVLTVAAGLIASGREQRQRKARPAPRVRPVIRHAAPHGEPLRWRGATPPRVDYCRRDGPGKPEFGHTATGRASSTDPREFALRIRATRQRVVMAALGDRSKCGRAEAASWGR